MAVAPIVNTKTNKPIKDASKTYYFLINNVVALGDRLKVTPIGYEVLEDKESVKEVISKYLPLHENDELCIYTCDERYIKHWTYNEQPTIEDVLEKTIF